MADQSRTVDTTAPTPAEVTRDLEQGLGLGQRELDAQREPAIDPPLLEEANPQEDWGQPVEGATYSANHAMRGRKSDAERGPGPKTRTAAKDAISRR
jgi:hypothetical protein